MAAPYWSVRWSATATHALLVAERGLEQGPEEAMGGGVEATDDAPVEDADAAVAEHQQVAGVDVAVEVAEPHGRRRRTP